MEVAGGRGHRGVTKGALNQVDGRAPVERVAGVRMTQPVRTHISGYAGPLCRLAHDYADAAPVKNLPASRLEAP